MRQADVFCVALGGASERKRSMVHRVHMLPQAFNRTVQGSAHDAHGEAHGVDIAVQSVCVLRAACYLLYSAEFLHPGPCGPAHQLVQDIGWQQAHDSLPKCCGSADKYAPAPY